MYQREKPEINSDTHIKYKPNKQLYSYKIQTK